MASSSLLISVLCASLFVTSAFACAVPHGGCLPSVCSSYSAVSLSNVYFPGANYSTPSTWLQGELPLMGFVLGRYNKVAGPGGYIRAGLAGTPALNLERFDLETNAINPATGKPYAIPSSETDLVSCCNKCAQTDGCWLYQFFDPSTPASFNNGVQCYLLSGGTMSWDFPGYGTPLSGSARSQGPGGSRASIPMSYVGGRCNGSTGVIADPHFVGAHGTRYDFNGEIDKSFCLTTDTSVHINTVLKGYLDTNTEGATEVKDGKALRTWMKELAFLWKDSATQHTHTLHLVARSGKQQERGLNGFLASASLDGEPLQLPLKPGTGVESGDLSFAFLGTVVKAKNGLEQDQYTVRIGEHLDVSLYLRAAIKKYQTPTEAQVHFNILINHLRTTEKVHGVLGQTYRNSEEQISKAVRFSQIVELLGSPVQADGKSGEGFLDGSMKDYQTSSVLAPDCKFSAFYTQALGPAINGSAKGLQILCLKMEWKVL